MNNKVSGCIFYFDVDKYTREDVELLSYDDCVKLYQHDINNVLKYPLGIFEEDLNNCDVGLDSYWFRIFLDVEE